MRALLTIIAFVLLSGCATSYKPLGFGGGYEDVRLSDNSFKVSFRGNGYTDEEKASNMALLRCSEIAIENGFSYFVIISENSQIKKSSIMMPTQSSTYGTATVYKNTIQGQSSTTTYGGQDIIISKPKTINTILCFNEKPDFNGVIYDANIIYNSLSAKYKSKSNIQELKNTNNVQATESRTKTAEQKSYMQIGSTGYRFYYDDSKWKNFDVNDKDGTMYFINYKKKLYLKIISLQMDVPITNFHNDELDFAKNDYDKLNIIDQKFVNVNNNKVNSYIMYGYSNDKVICSSSYVFSGKKGFAQMIGYTDDKDLFESNAKEFEEVLNGFVGENY